jgi:hypothetical protein
VPPKKNKKEKKKFQDSAGSGKSLKIIKDKLRHRENSGKG